MDIQSNYNSKQDHLIIHSYHVLIFTFRSSSFTVNSNCRCRSWRSSFWLEASPAAITNNASSWQPPDIAASRRGAWRWRQHCCRKRSINWTSGWCWRFRSGATARINWWIGGLPTGRGDCFDTGRRTTFQVSGNSVWRHGGRCWTGSCSALHDWKRYV